MFSNMFMSMLTQCESHPSLSVLLTVNGPSGGITCTRGSQEVTTGSSPTYSLRIGPVSNQERETAVFPLNFALLKQSSPLAQTTRKITVGCSTVFTTTWRVRASSPLPSEVSEVTRSAESLMPLSRCVLALAPLIRLVKAEQRPVLSGVWCVVVWCRVVVCVPVCACVQNTQENGTERVNKRGGNMVIIVWENTKIKRNIGEIIKTRTPF